MSTVCASFGCARLTFVENRKKYLAWEKRYMRKTIVIRCTCDVPISCGRVWRDSSSIEIEINLLRSSCVKTIILCKTTVQFETVMK